MTRYEQRVKWRLRGTEVLKSARISLSGRCSALSKEYRDSDSSALNLRILISPIRDFACNLLRFRVFRNLGERSELRKRDFMLFSFGSTVTVYIEDWDHQSLNHDEHDLFIAGVECNIYFSILYFYFVHSFLFKKESFIAYVWNQPEIRHSN